MTDHPENRAAAMLEAALADSVAEVRNHAETTRALDAEVKRLRSIIDGEREVMLAVVRRAEAAEARAERLAVALRGLLSGLGPGGYIPSAGEPATRSAQAALSTDADPRNQCDGCARGLPLVDGIHRNLDAPYDLIGCTAHLYRRPTDADPTKETK